MFEIKEILKDARDYVPTDEKARFIGECAHRCFDPMQITTGAAEALPTMYKENTALKENYLLSALLRLYLGIEAEAEDGEKDEWKLHPAEFDKWASLHLLNQIERAKSDAELKNKCFDLLQDYKTLEKRMNAEIYGLLSAMNDPVTRAIATVQSISTPEYVQGLQDELMDVQKKLTEYQEQKNGNG